MHFILPYFTESARWVVYNLENNINLHSTYSDTEFISAPWGCFQIVNIFFYRCHLILCTNSQPWTDIYLYTKIVIGPKIGALWNIFNFANIFRWNRVKLKPHRPWAFGQQNTVHESGDVALTTGCAVHRMVYNHAIWRDRIPIKTINHNYICWWQEKPEVGRRARYDGLCARYSIFLHSCGSDISPNQNSADINSKLYCTFFVLSDSQLVTLVGWKFYNNPYCSPKSALPKNERQSEVLTKGS